MVRTYLHVRSDRLTDGSKVFAVVVRQFIGNGFSEEPASQTLLARMEFPAIDEKAARALVEDIKVGINSYSVDNCEVVEDENL